MRANKHTAKGVTRLSGPVLTAGAVILLTALLLAAPLSAGEVLMSQSGFAYWLRQQFLPREQKLDSLESRAGALESRLADWELQNLSRIYLWPDRTQVEYYAPGGVLTHTAYLDVPPGIHAGRTMVPLRFVAEALGAQVLWNPKDRTVTYLADGRQVIFTLDQTKALVNGQEADMDTAPLLYQDRTMVPVRFAGQWLGALVKWDDGLKRVEIAYLPGGLPLTAAGSGEG